MGSVQQTKPSIQFHGPHMTSSKELLTREFRVCCSQRQLLLCGSDLTLYALLPEAIFDRCAPRMRYDTSKQAQHNGRSFPLHIRRAVSTHRAHAIENNYRGTGPQLYPTKQNKTKPADWHYRDWLKWHIHDSSPIKHCPNRNIITRLLLFFLLLFLFAP